MGRSCLSLLFMLKAFLSALICSLVLVGRADSQEVIVAHEKKPEAPKQAAPSSERTPSESPTPALTKSKSHEKKSGSTTLTAEQMRMAGALAAERLENRSSPQSARAGASDSEPSEAELPTVSATPKPLKKKNLAPDKRARRVGQIRELQNQSQWV